jgi:hypothetical protein
MGWGSDFAINIKQCCGFEILSDFGPFWSELIPKPGLENCHWAKKVSTLTNCSI